MRIINATRQKELASAAWPARGYLPRLIGLLGRARLEDGEALLIDPCNSVHTWFMRFTIDVLYVGQGDRVVKAVPVLRPFRISSAFRGSRKVVELPRGVIDATGTQAGDQLEFLD